MTLSPAVGAVLLLAFVAGGCNSSSEPVRGRDDDVFFPAVRVTVPFIGNERTITRDLGYPGAGPSPESPSAPPGEPPGGAPPVPAAPSLALDFDYGYGHGRSGQDLRLGQFLQLDNVVFNGPAHTSAGYDLHYFDVAVRGGVWFADRVGLEGMGGMGFQYARVEVESGGVRDTDITTRGSPLLGLQGTVKILRWLFVYGRGAWTLGYLEAAEAGIEARPYRGVGLMGGWKWWDFETDRDDRAALDLNFSGPFAGIHLSF